MKATHDDLAFFRCLPIAFVLSALIVAALIGVICAIVEAL